MNTGREIHLFAEADGWWSAVDQETGVASQGETRKKALDNLDEAVALTNETKKTVLRRRYSTHRGSRTSGWFPEIFRAKRS